MKSHFRAPFSTLLFVGLLTFSIHSQAKTQEQQATPAIPVTAQTISLTNVPLSYDYPARVKSPNYVEIHARVSGELLEQLFEDGDTVKQNQLLYRIDPRPYRAEIDRLKAQVLMEQAKLNQAEREKNRVLGLFAGKAVSEQERDAAVASYELALAGVAAAQAAQRQAQLNLDYTEVRAPISGKTGLKRQSVGNLVGRDYGQTLLTDLTQLDPIEIHFSIGEFEFMTLQQRIQSGEYRYSNGNQPQVSVDYMKQTLNGELNYTDHAVDSATGSIKLRARFDNPNSTLLPGAFVRIKLSGIEAVNTIKIPQDAVLQIGTQAFVYVIQDNKAQLVPVELGAQVGEEWLVHSGLKAGDQIVLDNLVKVRPGTSVQIVPASNNAPSDTAQAK
ncbi:MAG: efflux RND transporter periplasmic adaptor subunit [Thiomicrospira sp.]